MGHVCSRRWRPGFEHRCPWCPGEEDSNVDDLGVEQASITGDLRGEYHSNLGDLGGAATASEYNRHRRNDSWTEDEKTKILEIHCRLLSRSWTEDEKVALLDLVERVGLEGGAPRPNCWQLVETAAKTENVFTRRSAETMKQQYPLVVG
jgi:hypothetical protein